MGSQLLPWGLSPGSCLWISLWRMVRGRRDSPGPRQPGSLDLKRRDPWVEVHWARVEVESPVCQAVCLGARKGHSTELSSQVATAGRRGAWGGGRAWGLATQQAAADLWKAAALRQDSNPTLPPPSQVSPRDLVPLAAWKEVRGESCPCGSVSGCRGRRQKVSNSESLSHGCL